MVEGGKLDKQVVEALYDNYEDINESRRSAQEQELESLSAFWNCVGEKADLHTNHVGANNGRT